MSAPIPMFSILCPVLNRRSEMEIAIHSVLAQTWQEFELLIVDNGSSDGSAEYAEGWAAADPRIRVCREPRRGLAYARNCSARNGRGKWSVLLDSDNYFAGPDVLANLAELLRTHAGIVGLFTRCVTAAGLPIGPALDDHCLHRPIGLREYLRLPRAERAPVVLTAWFREHPYPEFPGSRTECPDVVWFDLARTGRLMMTNLRTQVYGTAAANRICGPLTALHARDMARCYREILRRHGRAIRNASMPVYLRLQAKKCIHDRIADGILERSDFTFAERIFRTILPPARILQHSAGAYGIWRDWAARRFAPGEEAIC